MGKLQGKVAVITGGSSGIGLATARLFVKEGAHVVITGRREQELAAAAKSIGERVTTVAGDVRNLDDLDRLYDVVRRELGGIDVLMANAGFVEHAALGNISPEHFDKTFGINARGVLFTVQKGLPLMRNGGSIILVSSIAGTKALHAHSTYSATKAAVRSLARTWTLELKDRGIRVNTISPGPVDTPIIDSQFDTKEKADKLREQFASVIPLGRMGRPEELATAALFLASDDSSFVAGIDLPVDGGMAQI
ncbi:MULTISPECIES: SDR family NAD(P)-dependent oxidoreductase [unclassified Variovorax]|uniref:SDR family NAD(P)-dependent oxidoreductase n=1 Tax=unclassified Variovorax TaxID=663243 RepID=UPI003ECD67C7